jgi:hypothetical protein
LRIELTQRRCVGALSAEQDVLNNCKSIFRTALRVDHLLATVLKDGALNQSLRTHAGVHARGLLVVVVVEDVRCAETQQWTATVDAVEVVVCICYAEMAGIFSGILVGVPYEGAFGLFRVSPRPASQRDVRI